MELVCLASESRNFLVPLTFFAVLLRNLVDLPVVNDDEFGMFVEIMSLLLKLFAGLNGVRFLDVFPMVI